jgi:hypothetical protein
MNKIFIHIKIHTKAITYVPHAALILGNHSVNIIQTTKKKHYILKVIHKR